MRNKNGFTLLELLIAATIVAALSVVSTIYYRNSVAETHIQAAKMRTEVLAEAVRRFRLDYGADKLTNGEFRRLVSNNHSCVPTTNGAVTSLITCDYVENDAGWSDAWIEYYVCNGARTAGTPCAKATTTEQKVVLACMRGRSTQGKLPSKYKNPYAYCVGMDGTKDIIEKWGN